MNKIQYQVGDRDVLDLVRADGDVAIKGWDEDFVELSLDGETEDCEVEQQGGALVINSRVSLAANVPDEMRVQIGQVRGDLVVSGLRSELSVGEAFGDCDLHTSAARISIGLVRGSLDAEETAGALTIKEAKGDVRLTNVGGPIDLGQVVGDLRARDVEGDLKLGTVQGDVRVRDAGDMITIEQVVGDFRGTDLRAGMSVHALGDLTLKTVLASGADYLGFAQGDISAYVPANSSARFTLKAKGGISTRLLRIEEMESGCVEGQMGSGEARVVLESDGHLALKPIGSSESDFAEFGAQFGEFGAQFGEFGESIAAQVEAQIAEQLQGMRFDDLARAEMEKAMAKLERDMAHLQHEAGERARRRAEELSRKVQEKARRAQERAQQAANRAAKHAEKRKRQFHFYMDAERPDQRSRSKVSEEEQLSILRMLQEGKITTEEAELLLKALEG